jgi:hypothetical protein
LGTLTAMISLLGTKWISYSIEKMPAARQAPQRFK